MKTINYTGSSKLISRIVNLLNRKAPLPLDCDGDPDWGTNGQFLTTDGAGGTTWSSGGGGGDSVSWTQTQVSGDKIAEIDINGTTTNVYAPSNPTVNDATLTITQNGSSLGTFTANASANVTIEVPGGGGGGTYTAGDGIDITNDEISVDTTFTESSARANIDSGDTLSTIWGKIKKFFTDLKTVAFTGSYTDLSDKPTIPAAQIQSDWNQTNNALADYIKNKPTNVSVFTNDAGYITSAGSCAYATSAGSAGSATSANKATQDADGNDIRNKYVNIYNSWDIGRLSTVTVNDLANQGSAVAMINAATDNPIGGAKWVHVWSQAWRKGVNTSWVSQLAMGVENGTGLWYRTHSGTAVGRAWKRVIDSDNIGSQSVNYATSAGSATTASRLALYQNNYLVTARTSWQTFTLTASSNIVSAMICPAGRQAGTPHFWIEFSGKVATIHYKNDTDWAADGYTIWLMF